MRLACTALSVRYNKRLALNGFSLSLKAGEIHTLIGPNGSGKSTALQAMAGLIQPAEGHVLINGTSIHTLSRHKLARKLAFLPQNPVAPAEMTVAQLVRQGRFAHVGLFRNYKSDDEQAITWALEHTGLIDFSNRNLIELSGGERQRAWIAAAIAQEADILLLDEPTSFLDICYQKEVLELLYKLSRERGVTIVMSIHDINQALTVCDRISLLSSGNHIFDGEPERLPQTGLIETSFHVEGRFINIQPDTPAHFDIRWISR